MTARSMPAFSKRTVNSRSHLDLVGSDASDGRVVNVAVTSAGRKVLQSAIDARNEVVRRRVERLGPKDQRALESAVSTLRKLLD
jgi:DNA-binding MarR family transcriptional regulator